MTLAECQAECYRRLGFETSPETEVVTRITGFINSTHKEIMSDPVLNKLRRKVLSFATVANQPYCVLPQAVERVYSMVDRTNQRPVELMSIIEILEADPGLTMTSSTPEGYGILDYNSFIARQPSDSSQLLIKSTAAETPTAYIEVITSQGYIRTASVAMTGTTAVNIGPSDVVAVNKLYLSAVAVGEITLLEDTNVGTELSRIGIGQSRARFTVIQVYPTPASVITLYVDADVQLVDLSNANDEFFLSDEYCEAIVLGVKKREFYKRDKYSQGNEEQKSADKILARLRHKMHRESGASNVSDRKPSSQLGPYYPAGS